VITSTPAAGKQAELSVLLYRNHDVQNCTTTSAASVVSVALSGLQMAPNEGGLPPMGVSYLIDQDASRNPMAKWLHMGSPTYPTADQFAQLRESAELQAVAGPMPLQQSEELTLELEVPCPGVLLHHICAAPAAAPAAVEALRLHLTPTRSPVEVLVYWKGLESNCLLTYEVFYSPVAGGKYHRANQFDTVFSSFVHAQVGTNVAAGCYRIRAVDYWGRQGGLSEEVCVAVVVTEVAV